MSCAIPWWVCQQQRRCRRGHRRPVGRQLRPTILTADNVDGAIVTAAAAAVGCECRLCTATALVAGSVGICPGAYNRQCAANTQQAGGQRMLSAKTI